MTNLIVTFFSQLIITNLATVPLSHYESINMIIMACHQKIRINGVLVQPFNQVRVLMHILKLYTHDRDLYPIVLFVISLDTISLS